MYKKKRSYLAWTFNITNVLDALQSRFCIRCSKLNLVHCRCVWYGSNNRCIQM